MNSTQKILELLDSPCDKLQIDKKKYSDKELLEIYEDAFTDRVGLLYLTLYRRDDWNKELEEKYQKLAEREHLTFKVISRLADKLNKFDADNYIIFKSVKPYPATPNDTDVIWMGDRKSYKKVYDHLLNNGYIFHEWAPQQKTFYDELGKGKIGKGKKGGTYYIDLYEEISTDYYAYLNKHNLKPYIINETINEINVKLLRAEPELAIVMFHSVFPERTYQLEHFYLPLYYFADENFDLDLFLDFTRKNGLTYAVKTQISIISHIHKKHFGYVPEPIKYLENQLGVNKKEVERFIQHANITPYLFSGRTFWLSFLQKTNDWYSFKSLLWQGSKMLNPKFFVEVMGSIKHRFSEKGAYHLE